MKVYVEMAKACGAYHRCVAGNNQEWAEKWENKVLKLLEQFPRGSGFDNGTKIELDKSNDDKLVFATAFHHMNDGGFYDGWTQHTVTVTPSLGSGYRIKVSGRDRNMIKDYIAEMFCDALDADILVESVA